MRNLITLFLFLHLFCLVFTKPNAQVRVVDGDTIHIGKNKYRLEGIDAPENRQECLNKSEQWECGKESTKSLRKKIEVTSQIRCEGERKDSYGRILAICFLGGKDINAWMVKNGWALAYVKYSKKYLKEQRYAKEKGLGIWKGQFVAPWDWRRGKRLEPIKNFQNGDCKIKGNISSKGEKIFHLPGGIYYDRTKISKQKGERWFCTVSEALNAGWRQSKR